MFENINGLAFTNIFCILLSEEDIRNICRVMIILFIQIDITTFLSYEYVNINSDWYFAKSNIYLLTQ